MSPFPSPNCGPRRNGLRPELIVIHYTAMPDFEGAAARLCDPVAEVSAHWLIDRDGRSLQLVDEDLRAWHAGAGEWRGEGDVNSRSIGIELVNRGDEPFPEPQMQALEGLLRALMGRWGLGPRAVIGHSDMAPGRKADPGGRFDWCRLARLGLADAARPEGPEPAEFSPKAFRRAALAYGYPDVEDGLLLAAFRLRFHPAGQGQGTPRDLALAQALAPGASADRATDQKFVVDGPQAHA